MTQVHKRYTVEQVKVLLQGYCQGNLSRTEVEEMLEIGKTRFFVLLKAYRQNSNAFSIDYQRSSPGRLSDEAEQQIKKELLRDKALIEDQELPITAGCKIGLSEPVPSRRLPHLVPDMEQNILGVRIWSKDKLVHCLNLPLNEFRRFE